MKILVRILPRNIINLEVESAENVKSLKQRMHDEKGILPDQQCLVFKGFHLDDERTLQDYNVKNEDTLYFRVPGGNMNIYIKNSDTETFSLNVKTINSTKHDEKGILPD